MTLIVHREPTRSTSSIRKHTESLITAISLMIPCSAELLRFHLVRTLSPSSCSTSITNVEASDFSIKRRRRSIGRRFQTLLARLSAFSLLAPVVLGNSLCAFDSLLRESLGRRNGNSMKRRDVRRRSKASPWNGRGVIHGKKREGTGYEGAWPVQGSKEARSVSTRRVSHCYAFPLLNMYIPDCVSAQPDASESRLD